MNPRFEINIDAINLEGFAPQDRRKIMEAFEQTLAQLFTMHNPGLAATAGDFDKMEGGCFQMNSSSKGNQLGTQIANSVYSAITGVGI
jgi:hypothetical protein